jgi:hypothetical protein
MKEDLQKIYKMAQAELTARNEEEQIYLDLKKELSFASLPEQITELLSIADPELNADSPITITFGHFNPYSSIRKRKGLESYTFEISWTRATAPTKTGAAVDGIYFSITPIGEKLKYELRPQNGFSNARSNRRSEDIYANQAENAPETVPLMNQYQEIVLLLQIQKIQDKLLEELVGIFLRQS